LQLSTLGRACQMHLAGMNGEPTAPCYQSVSLDKYSHKSRPRTTSDSRSFVAQHPAASMAVLGTSSLSYGNLIAMIAISSLVYCIGLGIYRLYFSPVSKFPGPRLAALSLWYEFYVSAVTLLDAVHNEQDISFKTPAKLVSPCPHPGHGESRPSYACSTRARPPELTLPLTRDTTLTKDAVRLHPRRSIHLQDPEVARSVWTYCSDQPIRAPYHRYRLL
jgi:hypothetical protein